MSKRKFLITGSIGQIGYELIDSLIDNYGQDSVIASDIKDEPEGLKDKVIYEKLDITEGEKVHEIVKKHKVNTIINLAAILSAKGEEMPLLTWKVNMDGLVNILEVALQEKCAVFNPSSIAVFGEGTPKVMTPQTTIQRPNTIYGVTKAAGENLCDYYHYKYGLDTRGVRYPGLISYKAQPGGGTTDYAVHIFFEAVKNKKYSSFINKGTKMDMMYMPDALKAMINLIEADPSRLIHRNAFNVTAMSFAPEDLEVAIKKIIPEFTHDYDVDPVRQAIAQSWPDSLDDSAAREEWDWKPDFGIDEMAADMIKNIKKMYNI